MSDVRLQPWSEGDLPLLEQLLGDPDTMTHLGGPESREQILRRHIRYVRLLEEGTDHMFKIVWGPSAEGVGNVGYWRKTWRDQAIYEMAGRAGVSGQGHCNKSRGGCARACPPETQLPVHACLSIGGKPCLERDLP